MILTTKQELYENKPWEDLRNLSQPKTDRDPPSHEHHQKKEASKNGSPPLPTPPSTWFVALFGCD